jgi:hypothetical protein
VAQIGLDSAVKNVEELRKGKVLNHKTRTFLNPIFYVLF